MGPQGAQTAGEGPRHALAEIESAVAVEVDALEEHLELVVVHEANERQLAFQLQIPGWALEGWVRGWCPIRGASAAAKHTGKDRAEPQPTS